MPLKCPKKELTFSNNGVSVRKAVFVWCRVTSLWSWLCHPKYLQYFTSSESYKAYPFIEKVPSVVLYFLITGLRSQEDSTSLSVVSVGEARWISAVVLLLVDNCSSLPWSYPAY